MKTKDAYNIILKTLSDCSDCEIVDYLYNSDVFGNFIIGFIKDNKPKSFVCDRGQIYLCNDLKGNLGCCMIVPSISEVCQENLVMSLESNLMPR